MKKFWIFNLLGTLILLVIFLRINHYYYNSKMELYIGIVTMGLLAIQFAGGFIYGVIQVKKHSQSEIILGLFSLAFLILSMLFVFNAAFWSTDIGGFRHI